MVHISSLLLQFLILICRLDFCRHDCLLVLITDHCIYKNDGVFDSHRCHIYMSGCGYGHIKYLIVMYHHSNSVTYISSCKHS